MAKKVLVLGATGAMGKYLIPLLAEKGYEITAVYRKDNLTESGITCTAPNVRYVDMNVMELDNFRRIASEHWDGIVDFMIYSTWIMSTYLPIILQAADHYIYFSSYRIYDGKDVPVREDSRRLIDTADNAWLKCSDDYCIYKARGENALRECGLKNWTIVRPSITYSVMRNQLVTLECQYTTYRALNGKKTILPIESRDIQGTMTWAGDAAKMLAGLLFNPAALGEAYTISTAEHHTWGEIADMYNRICGLECVWVDKEDYLKIIHPENQVPYPRWQLEYDRLFNRVIDNSKVLSATGMKQEELMPLHKGLEMEIGRFPLESCGFDGKDEVSLRMDDYLRRHSL
ncbi:MAG: NAD(P)H-binding protein [Victivallales bacterium]|nr:NAD(P)H-binding protein [Victivallales bacterium]